MNYIKKKNDMEAAREMTEFRQKCLRNISLQRTWLYTSSHGPHSYCSFMIVLASEVLAPGNNNLIRSLYFNIVYGVLLLFDAVAARTIMKLYICIKNCSIYV